MARVLVRVAAEIKNALYYHWAPIALSPRWPIPSQSPPRTPGRRTPPGRPGVYLAERSCEPLGRYLPMEEGHMTTDLSSILVAAAVIVAAPHRLASQTTPPPIQVERVMSSEERAATGIAHLSDAERAAFEAWLARYTATVAAVASAMMPAQGEPAPAPDTAALAAAETRGDRHARGPRTVPLGARVANSADDGTVITLADGTMWEIYLPDRTATSGWHAGDFIIVRPQPAPVGDYGYALVNGAARRTASARFAGLAPRAEKP